MRHSTLARLTALSMALSMAVSTQLSAANEERGATYQLDIPAQSLNDALQALALAAKHEMLYSAKLVEGKQSPALKGQYTAEQAVRSLLTGTELEYELTSDGLVIIRAKEMPAAANAEAKRNITGAQNVRDRNVKLAWAQENNEADRSAVTTQDDSTRRLAGRAEIEEVLVTATKRTERMQDVPMSIAVLTGQELDRRGVVGMEDYLRSMAGVNQIDLGTNKNGIIIRGITTSPDREDVYTGTNVSVYFDETPITGAAGTTFAGPDPRPVDMERIEVLRGPQGTAYGSSSMGGTVRLIPAQPKLDGFGGKVAASYSQTGGYGGENSMVQAVVNIPLIQDTLALRAVGYRFDQSGFYKNIAGIDPLTLQQAQAAGLGDFVQGHVQDEVGRTLTTGGRLAALWRPTDRLELAMNLLTQSVEQDGQPISNWGDYRQARLPVAPVRRIRGEVGEAIDTEIELLGNLVMRYDLGWGELTTVVSKIDGSSQGASFSALPTLPSTTAAPSTFESFTAETRIASRFDGRFQFLAGLFYEDIDTYVFQTVDWPGTPATNPLVTTPNGIFETARKIEQRAAFGEISYDVTSKLTATVGGRYYDYDKQQSSVFEGGIMGIVGGVPVVPIGAGVPTVQEAGDSGSIGRANLSYKPTSESMVYASWSEGFRLGGPTGPGLPPSQCDTDNDGFVDGTSITIASTRSVRADVLENYELGGKLALFDRRLSIDASVYHIDWTGLPISQVAPGCLLAFTANAGEAVSDGLELQVSLAVTDRLRLDFGGGYTKAELSKDAPNLGARKGARLPGSPKVSANLSAQYDFDWLGHRAFLRADSSYTGEFYGNIQATPDYRVGDYVKVDARAGIAIDRVSVELFVQNLKDEDAATWRSALYRGAIYQLRPRTIGVQLGYSFE